MKVSYKSAGVNINEAEIFINKIKPLVKETFTPNVQYGIGNFGAFYKIDFKKYKHPVLVSSVDGVGTKLKIAAQLNKFDSIGEDLVNHCVNDIAVCGAVPLFFLDYYATGRLKSNTTVEIIKGIARGCKNNSCSLIGGETAEMPGLYHGTDFDLAGMIVGIAGQNKILNADNVKKNDVLIGLRSNGLHTNGYSLVRKLLGTKRLLNQYNSELGLTFGEELLKVHRSYLNIIQSSIKRFKINSISHITGGGIIGNTKRVIKRNMGIDINWKSWKRPYIFDFLQKKGHISEPEMRKTFNLGIGLVFIVSENILTDFMKFLKSKKEDPCIIGNVI